MPTLTARYILPAMPSVEAAERAIAAELGLEPRGAGAGRLVYLDSFDWRLHRAGLRLYAETDPERGPMVVLQGVEDGRAVLRVAGELPEAPLLARDIPWPALRDRLAPLLSVRALLPVADLAHETRAHVRRDGRGKVVLRVAFERLAVEGAGGDAREQITLEGLRGYAREREEAEARLRGHWRLLPAAADALTWALRAQGRAPGDYTAKPRAAIEPGMPAGPAVTLVLAGQAGVMQRNEDGILRDLDSEFLHDFRIALRRARSLLADVKGVVPEPCLERLRADARPIAAETGALRDLDVHLLELDDYRRMLPEDDRPALDPLADFLAVRRSAHLQSVRRLLRSASYRRFVEALAGPVGADAERADWPVEAVADSAVRRAFRRVVRDGRAIDAATPAEALHALRKRAKRLRYLLEMFSPLYPKEDMRPAVKALTGLQRHLGRFQDLVVHAETLRRLAREMTEEGGAGPDTLLAMGRLVHAFEAEQAAVRTAFAERFAAFDTARTHDRFDALLSSRPPAAASRIRDAAE